MKTSRKTMLIAAFVVAVVALAGVGYAAVTHYKAVTVNGDNAASNAYIVATQSESDYVDKFEGTVALYTYTDATHPAIYTIPESSSDLCTISETAYRGVAIGTGATITVKNQANAAVTNFAVTAQKVGDALPTGWTYIVGYTGTGADEVFAVLGQSANVTSTNGIVTAKLYIAAPAANTFNALSGQVAGTFTDYDNCASSTSYTGSASLYTNAEIAFTFSVPVS